MQFTVKGLVYNGEIISSQFNEHGQEKITVKRYLISGGYDYIIIGKNQIV